MSWGDWMIVEWTLEEELQIEAQSRSALNHHSADEVRQLCSSLIRQYAYQNKLMKQAVGHIAKIEMEQFLTGSHHQPQAAHGIFSALANGTARNAKRLANLPLRLLRAVQSMIGRYNIPIPFS